jgi:HSP20 family protein
VIPALYRARISLIKRRYDMAGEKHDRMLITPPVSIRESEKEVVIEAEMTGLAREDITLDLTGDELTLKGVKKGCEVPEGYTPLYRERCPLEYSRTFILGNEVKKEGIRARYSNGLLSVVVPKSEMSQPRRIQISE